jgi:hypothetical protein
MVQAPGIDVRGARPRSGVRAAALLALLVTIAAGAPGCEDTHILTGTFRSDAAVPFAGQDAVRVELVLGHYGPDVAGLLRFFETDDFLLPVAADDFCECRPIAKGTFDYEDEVLAFTFRVPYPCGKPGETYVSATLTMSDSGDLLTGTWSIPSIEGQSGTWRFEREKNAGDLVSTDLECKEQ